MSGTGAAFLIWALAAFSAVMFLALLRQVSQRKQLQHWLDDPEQHEIPEGSGAWRQVFSRLQRLRKEEAKARTALGGSLDRFLMAAQALPDGVILLDAVGRIEWLNHSACQHFGLDPRRDVGTLVEQLIRQTVFVDQIAAFRAQGIPAPFVMQVEAEGARRVISISLLSFAGTGILLLSRDISEITRVETMRRDFIANVSHELRTPLTVISGFLEQLTAENGLVDESIRGFLLRMAEQSQRMNRLVEDLLMLSRLENAAAPPRDEVIDVPEMLGTLLDEACALSAGNHVIEAGRVETIGLRGSSDEIRSAFSNLVTNAIRYTPAGGKISLSWQSDGDNLVFAVTDTGIGIPAEHIPRLTERFYRVDRGRSAATGGTGLGLAIVKHVLARHQGALQISSAVGQGSTFAARLPRERMENRTLV